MKFLLTFVLIMMVSSITAQEIIVRTNGARIEARILTISDDSVRFKTTAVPGGAIYTLPKSDVRFIEYNNNKIDYFEGSYVNSSKKLNETDISGFEVKERKLLIDGIQFSVENLFTENHLIMDYHLHHDSAFIAEKGKMEFLFENKRNNFFIRFYPTSLKTVFAKFEFSGTGGNKKYNVLSENLVSSIAIYYSDSVSQIILSGEQSENLRELFLNKNIQSIED